MSVVINPMQPGDRKLVISSWLDSFRTSYTAGLIAMEDWYPVMWPQVEKVLDRPATQTLVARETSVRSSSLADLYGFITFDPTPQRDDLGREWSALVHYVYVKEPYRRGGIARGLFRATGINARSNFAYACKTAVVSRLGHEIPLARWAPLLARFPKTEDPRRTE